MQPPYHYGFGVPKPDGKMKKGEYKAWKGNHHRVGELRDGCVMMAVERAPNFEIN